MSIRRRMMLAAFLGGWIGFHSPAADPPVAAPLDSKPLAAVSANQALANTVAGTLRQSGHLKGYTIEISVVGSSVELSGTVANQPQREEVLRLVQGLPGVERVVDRLRPVDALVKVQGVEGQPAPGTIIGGQLPPTVGQPLPGQVLPGQPLEAQPIPGQPILGQPIPGQVVPGQPLPGQPGPVNPTPLPTPRVFGGAQPGDPLRTPGPLPGPIVGEPPLPIPAGPVPGAPGEPVPIFSAPGLGFNALNPPQMPPYSWPTYAPYNNYSRVAYPEAYPYNAWPFIGPMHPFPKVPLGWRSVKLEWDDGYWWFSRTATRHDWWRLRFR